MTILGNHTKVLNKLPTSNSHFLKNPPRINFPELQAHWENLHLRKITSYTVCDQFILLRACKYRNILKWFHACYNRASQG